MVFSALSFAFFNTSHLHFAEEKQPDLPNRTSITISAVGDLMCHAPQFEYAKVSADSFDFSSTFREVKKYFDSSNFVFGNLETVTLGKGTKYSGYPFFNSPDDYIASLKKAGFNFLFTANNHSLDRGETGVFRTLAILKKYGINSTGTFASQHERDSMVILSANGIRFAVIAYTYGINGNYLSKGKSFLINCISDSSLTRDIQKAKLCDVDFILVYFHFGEEYQREPNSYQKRMVQLAIKSGADIILASHPHVLQPVQFFKSAGKIDTGFVAYSLGNFFSNQRWRYSDAGAILQFKIVKDAVTKALYLEKFNCIPTWVYKGKFDEKKQFVILPAGNSTNYDSIFPQGAIKLLRQSFNDTKYILRKYSANLQLNEE